jgi:TRAP-type C4-dicarboxylate transport system permease small subunit
MENELQTHDRGMLFQLQRAQLWLAATALIFMMLVTVVDVFMRYVFNNPVRGSYDFVEAMLVVFVFHGMASTFFTRSNIVIDLIDGVISQHTRISLVRAADVLSIIALCVIAWAMVGPAMQAFNYGDKKLELGLPIFILWIFALTGVVTTILCAVGALATNSAVAPRGEVA